MIGHRTASSPLAEVMGVCESLGILLVLDQDGDVCCRGEDSAILHSVLPLVQAREAVLRPVLIAWATAVPPLPSKQH